MAHTFEELKKKTVADLREIAKDVEHEAVQGYSTMNKDHLIPALCKALGIEAHAHHEVVGINKVKVKKKIQSLKKERDRILSSGDDDKTERRKQLKSVLRQIHNQKRRIHKATN
jgi:DNA-binding IclR family transcriptional regulator